MAIIKFLAYLCGPYYRLGMEKKKEMTAFFAHSPPVSGSRAPFAFLDIDRRAKKMKWNSGCWMESVILERKFHLNDGDSHCIVYSN